MLTQQQAGAAAPGPWTPASLPGMPAGRSGWWTYTAGLPSVGSPVDSWAASAGMLGALASSGTSRPTMSSAGPHADGIDDVLEIAGISPSLPLNDWAAWVVSTADQDLQGWLMSGDGILNIRRLSAFDQVRVTVNGTTANDASDINSAAVTKAVSILVTRDSASGTKAYADGVEFLTDADITNNAAMASLTLFMNAFLGWIGGTVHDCGFHDGALSGADLSSLQTHLETIRTGV